MGKHLKPRKSNKPIFERLSESGLTRHKYIKCIKAGIDPTNKELVNRIVSKNFESIFEVVISGDDVLHGKPNPEPYLKAIKKLNCHIKEIIVI
jgi:beta-phosphoglucomutase-like phosphatase (HAD superfamily)